MRRLRALAVVVAVATVVSAGGEALAMLGVIHTAGLKGAPRAIVPFFLVAVLTTAVVGLLVVLRRPRNRIAWILLLGALSSTLGTPFWASDGWSLQAGRALWPLIYAWPIAIAYVFPTGRFLSRRWRWIGLAGAACFVLFMAFALLDPEPLEENPSIHNPLAGNAVGSALLASKIWIPLWIGILASLFAGAASVVLRLRRSRGVERLQMLWLTWAASLVPLGLVLCGLSWLVLFSWMDMIVYPFMLVMQGAIATAIGIAVTRYRLYAIERLINRTVVYAILTVLLGATYAAVAVGLGVVFGRGSGTVTAGATLAAALVFRPLRARVQEAVDRRFDRTRVEAVRRVRAFEDDVRERRRAPEAIGDVLAQALRDPRAELIFWLPASEAFATAAGTIVGDPAADARVRTEIRSADSLVAVLFHDPALAGRPALLEAIISAATLSIEIACLRVEVRRQLGEVEASRRRIVEAGYEERRRLERDLHDGAQQRLVSLGMVLRRLERSLPPEAKMLAPTLDAAVGEVGAAVADLRTIAAGVRPPRLDDGLTAALHDLARTSPLTVEVDAELERVAASIEAAAYFVACEALTNAVKHASASSVALRVVQDEGTLRVSVADDGVGGAVVRRGSGLAGLRDRVAAHGGGLEVFSPPGGGTRIEVAIPCES